MHFVAILNRDGGTLRTTDLDAFSTQLREKLEGSGHSVDVKVLSGKGLVRALEAAASGACDVVLAGGGDGTVSAAAAALMDSDKALAVLPAGTMNLFARSLGIPLTLEAAIEAFADGEIRAVDIASANGRPFVHQFSIGMHAKLVQLRSKMDYASRWGKIRASAKAAWSTVTNPPEMKVKLTVGEAEMLVDTTGIGVTNNLFGEGHLPYADDPDGGILGIYVSVAQQRTEMIRFVLNVARGKWEDNDQVEIHQANRVQLEVLSHRSRMRATIDGELVRLERKTDIQIHPRALRVLVPRPAEDKDAA